METEDTLSVINIFDEVLYVNLSTNDAGWELRGNSTAPTAVFLPSVDLNQETELFLQKMLAACKLEPTDYFFILIQKPEQLLSALGAHQKSNNLVFGLEINSEVFNIRKEKDKPFRFNGNKWLLGESLTELLHDHAKKSSLWTKGLKPLYKI
jgi:DNA polymerase III psi subunit